MTSERLEEIRKAFNCERWLNSPSWKLAEELLASVDQLTAENTALREELEKAPKLWNCPDCGFGMDVIHLLSDSGAGLGCPSCAETKLEAESASLRQGVETLRKVAYRLAGRYCEEESTKTGQRFGLRIDGSLENVQCDRPSCDVCFARAALRETEGLANPNLNTVFKSVVSPKTYTEGRVEEVLAVLLRSDIAGTSEEYRKAWRDGLNEAVAHCRALLLAEPAHKGLGRETEGLVKP